MISIIIPLYNHADKIAGCLDGILKQSYQNYEIIIINDGSKDKPLKIIKKYEKKFKEGKKVFKYFEQENKGAPSARNKGFEKSKGNYIIFCDADAILETKALEKMLKKLNENNKISYTYPSFVWGKKKFKVGSFDSEKLKTEPFIHTMALIRREDFTSKGWDESIKKFQDWDLWLTMLEEGKRGGWIDETLFKVKSGGTMSEWLPSFIYKAMPFLPQVKKYKKAMSIIKNKHNIK